MFKFFRKFRQQLLIENKFNRYLLYATGEIFLVVIGILIALQINNWNTSKSDQQVIKNFMHSMESNLEEDIVQLGLLSKKRNDAQRIFPKIVRDLNSKVISNVDTFNLGFTLAISEAQFIANRSGFTGLMNSGFIEKVPFSIAEKFYRYYFLVDELNRVELKYNAFCEEMESNMHMSKGVVAGLLEILIGRQSMNVPMEEYLIVAPLEAIFLRGPYDIGEILRIYEQLESKAEELLLEITAIS